MSLSDRAGSSSGSSPKPLGSRAAKRSGDASGTRRKDMAGTALITGGAGFIGSHLASELLENGYRVKALDDLNPQVHEDGGRPSYLHPDVDLSVGDVRDPEALKSALEGVD